MREDLPSSELQDLCPAKGDGQVPIGWARVIDQACTAWLLKRGLYGSPSLHGLFVSPAVRQQSEEDDADIAPPIVNVNGSVFHRRRLRVDASAPAAATPGAGTEDVDRAARVSGEEEAR